MEEKKINSMPVINEKINIEYINEYKIKINNLNKN